MVSVRAVYHNGQLHLLDPVDLNDGEEILLQIVPKRPSVRELIGDMLATVEQK
ncbi:MAG: antitoxin family protein, partial [Anaerolineaceae bacterium]|nr:antitoxin family protein [Anaerolineaceae bacterium]